VGDKDNTKMSKSKIILSRVGGLLAFKVPKIEKKNQPFLIPKKFHFPS